MDKPTTASVVRSRREAFAVPLDLLDVRRVLRRSKTTILAFSPDRRHGIYGFRLPSSAFTTSADSKLPAMLGERVKKLRLATLDPGTGEPMGVRELARRVGVAHVTILDIESGAATKIRGDTLLTLASIFRVSPEWLLYGRGPKDARVPAGKAAELLAIYDTLPAHFQDALLRSARAYQTAA